MDHYFNSIAKHLTDGGGGVGTDSGSNNVNGSSENGISSNPATQSSASRSGSMTPMGMAMNAAIAAAGVGGGAQQQQQRQVNNTNNVIQGMPGMPGSRSNSMVVHRQQVDDNSMNSNMNNIANRCFPGPLSGITGSRQNSINSTVGGRQGSVGNNTNINMAMAPSPMQQGSVGVACPTPQPSMQGMVAQQQQRGSFVANSSGAQQKQRRSVAANPRVVQQQQQTGSFVDPANLCDAQQQQQQRGSFIANNSGNTRSSMTSSNNPFTSKELLNMLDDDLHETNKTPPGIQANSNKNISQQLKQQQQIQQRPQQQTYQAQQQQQMMMAMIKQQQQLQQQQQNQQQQVQMNQGQPNQSQMRKSQITMQQKVGRQQGSNISPMQQHQGSNRSQQQQHMQQQQQGHQMLLQQGSQMQQQQGNQMQQAKNQMNNQQQQQIQHFLQLHGHQLTQQQRVSLQQQLVALQRQNNSTAISNISGMNPGGGNGNGAGVNASQINSGGGGNQTNDISNNIGQGMDRNNNMNSSLINNGMRNNNPIMNNQSDGQQQSAVSMDDLMLRQREQLRHLQSMLKSHGPGHEVSSAAAQVQQQQQLNSMLQQQVQAAAAAQQAIHQQQGDQQQDGGGGMGSGGMEMPVGGQRHRQSASSMVMQQMIQQQQQRQLRQMAQQAQQQAQPLQQGKQQQAARQDSQQQAQIANTINQLGTTNQTNVKQGRSQGGSNLNNGRMRQRQSTLQKQHQEQSQQSIMKSISNIRQNRGGSISPVPIGSKSPGPAVPPIGSTSGNQNQTQQQNQQGDQQQQQRQQPMGTTSNPSTTSLPSNAAIGAATPSSSGGGSASSSANSTRVVPVSISPIAFASGAEGEGRSVTTATLIYTRYALQSIVASLNARSRRNGDGNGREYTVRDLSTCLGAWDLNIPTTANKRQKVELDGKTNSDPNDSNADTAFQFYYERSCPILLDAGGQPGGSSSSSVPLPFCVEDFGDSAAAGSSTYASDDVDKGLPVVTGAVVLTYGADSKFTGGIGEEGVMTKAIVEFFYDEAVAASGLQDKDSQMNEDAMVEAEEQIFARVNLGEHRGSSPLVHAALHALSPSDSRPRAGSTSSASDNGAYIPTIWSGNTDRIYQYCLLGNFDDNGRERLSKRLCVAIQKKRKRPPRRDGDTCNARDDGPARGVCRITLTLSPQSVLSKKRRMAKESEGALECDQSSSEVHRYIRKNMRTLRPPKLTTVSETNDDMEAVNPSKRRRQALRRRSVTQLIDHTMIVVGVRCKHELLLDADEVGKVYVNGALVVDCSSTSPSGSGLHGWSCGPDALPAHTLFGVDFTLPNASLLPGRADVKREYSALLVDALIDAGQRDADVAGKLLSRLITGSTAGAEENFEVDDYEEGVDGGGKKESGQFRSHLPSNEGGHSILFDSTSHPCLESIVLSNTAIDPVGIGAKALGTKFRLTYGADAFPCEIGTNDGLRLSRALGAHRFAVPVPRRARDVLLRGAYLSIDEMAKFLWEGGDNRGGIKRQSWDGNHGDAVLAAKAMEGAIKLLHKARCTDVRPDKIRFVARKRLEPVNLVQERRVAFKDDALPPTPPRSTLSASNLRCWYDDVNRSFYVSDAILFAEEEDGQVIDKGGAEEGTKGSSTDNSVHCLEVNSQSYKKSKATEVGDAEPQSQSKPADSKCTPISCICEEEASSKTNCNEGKVDTNDGNARGGNDKTTMASGQADKKHSKKEEETKKNGTEEAASAATAGEGEYIALKSNSGDEQLAPASADEKEKKRRAKPKLTSAEDAAYLLAFCIAREHPNDRVLERFVIMCRHSLESEEE